MLIRAAEVRKSLQDMGVPFQGLGFVMSQVPSDRRVTTVPSGCVALAVENEPLPVEPAVTEDPALDDEVLLDADVPAEDEVDPPAEWVVVVRPSMVVDEVTLPPPAVTDEDRPPPVACTSPPWMTVQVVPSSSVTWLEDATAIPPIRISGRARGWARTARALIMIFSWVLVPGVSRNQR